MNSQLPPPLSVLDTERFRQQLATFVDERDEIEEHERDDIKSVAVDFVSALPLVFGDSLERVTLWDKIGAALESAYAKTAGDDCDFFVSRVLESIQAAPAAVARTEAIGHVIMWLESVTPEIRHAWLAYIATHRYAVLVRARNAWEQIKEERRHV